MRRKFEEFMHKHGSRLCDLAIMVGSVSVDACYGHWYQPKEPDGLQDFLKRQRK